MKILKKNTKEVDNVKTRDLYPLITEFLNSIDREINSDTYTLDLQELEFERRDGFLPHSHNRGGMDLINLVMLDQIEFNFVAAPNNITDRVHKEYTSRMDDLEKDNPDADEDTISELFQESLGDYDTYARRVRVMYEGNGLVAIHYGWDDDAPYFRWNGNCKCIEVEFRNKKELKSRLAKQVKTIVNYFNNGEE